ncbi:unnamed protein product [Linum tenue]|uniref:Aminotransferase-like plant mobile domain-containing protein n=1 Tax=Linum tenue TaxID=586396 RepID=A0AAV0QBY2_9ROSI|nr:unnamed protein product [Linum tenue]
MAHLVDITLRKELDTTLISAFIERWQPDTNTFHMPFGEMTILLHDVHHILGVPVDGERMSVDTGEMLTLDVDMCELLGMTKGQISMGAKRPGGRERAAWYNGHGLLGDEALQYVRMHGTASREAQCYLLLLLGSTLFVDKSKDRVKAVVNLFLKNPELVNGLRPSQLKPRDVPDGQPFASRWRGIPPLASYKRDNHLVHHYREAIDNLTARQVDWTPYGQSPHIKLRRSLYSGGVISFADVSEVLREIFTKIAPVLDAGGESREQLRARSDEFYDIIKGVQQLWAEYKQMLGQP